MLGVYDDVLVLFDDINNVELYVELLGYPKGIVPFGFCSVVITDCVGMPLDAEAGIEVNTLYVYALLNYQSGCQHRI